MALTQISNILEPAIWLQYSKEYNPEKFDLFSSSAIVSPPAEVAAQMSAGGRIIDMPFWQDTSRAEPDLQDDTTTLSTSLNITAAEEKARKIFWAKSWSQADLAGAVATGSPKDPLQQITDFIINYWRASYQTTCIKVLDGILAKDVATYSSDMLYSTYSDVVSGSITSAMRISPAGITGARLTFGEMLNDAGTIVCHSKVYGDMLNQEAITFVQPHALPFKIPTYAGMNVVVSDQCTVVAGTNSPKYRNYILGDGAIQHMEHLPDMAQELYREPLKGNGGGITSLISRRQAIFHPKGWQFTSSSVAGKSPTWAEISASANWLRARQRKNIKIAYLETN
ncbi:hypothetical protein UFOVP143_54 [uncultured Caudovirales phage]|uniref:Coat protein n=1 Tax=uncultured Caudovirales phage TaxID=2100421 RepID=A0A6J7VQJ0_9CAUD|nr:hypothetical protein UFOVP143_54 [uncultured Caudovirales phage]